jgi:phospholipid/cholesterol/gamma-HCH transport system substrate-binding protein
MTQAMPPHPDTPIDPPAPLAPAVKNLQIKAVALMLGMALLIAASVVYVLYARGAFELTQKLVLLADDSEGITPGMDLTFSGFPVGRVRQVALADDGNVRIYVDVPRQQAKWLRTTSVFTMESSLVGGTRLRAFSGVLTDPQLPAGAERTVLRGDASSEIPKLVASMKQLTDNLGEMTASDAPLNLALAQVKDVTASLNQPKGAIKTLLGEDAQKVTTALNDLNKILSRVDGLAQKTDTQVFGKAGLMPQTQASMAQLTTQLGNVLQEAQGSLKKVDAVLAEAQAVGVNAKVATQDLGVLRQEVDASMRKVDNLISDINRKWPFARDTEIKLP